MLVLSRKRDESIIITVGDIEVVVMVGTISHNKVRIGIDAPREVSIRRKEFAINQ